MKRAMISQPMKGRTDSEIACDRARASGALGRLGYEVVDTLYEDFGTCVDGVNVPLLYLARSLGDMARCDAVYFCRGWSEARGCCVEHLAAKLYGLETIYEDWAESAMAFSVIDASTGAEAERTQRNGDGNMTSFGMPVFADVSDGRVQSLKVLEESSELCEAGKICDKVAEDYKKVVRTSMLDEFADVVQSMANFAACFEITDAEISQALIGCVERNKERGRY